MTTDVSIVATALTGIGANDLQSFDDETTEARVAAQIYPVTRDAMLSAHPWNFATGQHDLNRLVTAPLGDYTYYFQLPADLIRIIAAKNEIGRNILDYRVEGDRLACSAENVRLVFIYRPDESLFPPHFVQALIKRLSAEFVIPLTDSTTRYDLLMNIAASSARAARNIDSQQDTPQAITSFPLWDARGGSGRIEPDGPS